jgi:hypothetical protein
MGEAPKKPALPLLPRTLGGLGLGGGVGACLVCLYALFGAEAGVLWSALFAPVAVLGMWLWWGFLRLEDWHVAPDIPVGVKTIGHGTRVVGSIGAAACVSLLVLTIIYPGAAPPDPMRLVDGHWQALQPGSAALKVARPALAVLYLGGVFVGLGVRLLGSAMSELRRTSRAAMLVALGSVVSVLTVILVLNETQWRLPLPMASLIVADCVLGVWFLFLLGYLVRPGVAAVFEERGL